MQSANFSQGPSVYSIEEMWKDPAPIARKYRAFLVPDSDNYFSAINPVFSFELENFSLGFFNTVSLRDGVYPLLKFFALNPVPKDQDCDLVIDAELSALVPESWRKKVFLRELYVEDSVFMQHKDECLILISPDRDSQPLDRFQKEIEKHKAELDKFKKISVYFSSCSLKGEEEIADTSNWGYKLLHALMTSFPGKEMAMLDRSQYQSLSAEKITFLQINPLKFYYSDSFLVHDLLQRGARPVQMTKPLRSHAHLEKVSIHHGHQIYPWEGQEYSYFNDHVTKFFGHQNINVKPSWDDYLLVKLTIPEFKDMASAVAGMIANT